MKANESRGEGRDFEVVRREEIEEGSVNKSTNRTNNRTTREHDVYTTWKIPTAHLSKGIGEMSARNALAAVDQTEAASLPHQLHVSSCMSFAHF